MLWLCVWEEEIFMDLCEQPVVSAIPIQVHSISIGAKKKEYLGAPGWLSHKASAFGSGHDPSVLGLRPASGSLLSGKPASPSPSPPACVPSLAASLSVK